MPYRPAPFFRRVAARVLDIFFSLILTVALGIPMTVLLLLLTPVVALVAPELAYEVGYGAAIVCYIIAYVGLELFLLVRREGQTLGKGLMGLRVVAKADPARSLSLVQGIIRMLLVIAPLALASAAGGNPNSAMLNVLATGGLLAVIVSGILIAIPIAGRSALHDYAAGSRVVVAQRRRINFQQDARLLLPGKVDMTKRI